MEQFYVICQYVFPYASRFTSSASSPWNVYIYTYIYIHTHHGLLIAISLQFPQSKRYEWQVTKDTVRLCTLSHTFVPCARSRKIQNPAFAVSRVSSGKFFIYFFFSREREMKKKKNKKKIPTVSRSREIINREIVYAIHFAARGRS